MPTNNKLKFLSPVLITAFILLIGLLAAFMAQAELWVSLGLDGMFWYLILIVLGASVSACFFHAFKSYGKYKGKALGGKVELGGPGVLMLVIVALGLKVAPQPQTDFDYTIYVQTPDGTTPIFQNSQHSQPAQIRLILGDNPMPSPIGLQGEARFNNIAGRFRNQPIKVALLNGYPYQLAAKNQTVKLEKEAAFITIEPQQATLQGRVETTQGQPIAGAKVRVGETVKTTTNEGRFNFTIPANLPKLQQTIEVTAQGFTPNPWRGQFNLTGAAMTVQLQ